MYNGINSEYFRVLAKIVTKIYLLSEVNNDNTIDGWGVCFANKIGKHEARRKS